jgi:Universal stress protein family
VAYITAHLKPGKVRGLYAELAESIIKRIMVATDGSDGADRAVDYVAHQAKMEATSS